MSSSKLYQDQIYGAKSLSPCAVAVIDTPEFQRLVGLKQLGFSNVVFRGAHHTRFEHSVGTYFACRTMARRIGQNHERMGRGHPGLGMADSFAMNPQNAGLAENYNSAEGRWRGVREVVSLAGLLHDIGHVPFGHTLEDEFTGLYEKHDSVGSARVHTMLFNPASALASVFASARYDRWLPGFSNEDLAKLIYVILSWKERIEPAQGFEPYLNEALAHTNKNLADVGSDIVQKSRALAAHERLAQLKVWYELFHDKGEFHPFMSDMVGNTICADLLDYLPRDRTNLGMEAHHQHNRIQRYFVVQEGSYRSNEGLRLTLVVTRKGRGGRRHDVATSILAIMRQRYEMAEAVYYHHKKAAASSMLVKLLELVERDHWPRDDEAIYPAPWSRAPTTQDGNQERERVPHMVHLSDDALLEYLGRAPVPAALRQLQAKLYAALRYRRDDYYRTLMVIDTSLVATSPHTVSYFADQLRGSPPAAVGRSALEGKLAEAAGTPQDDGSVILYCPSQRMQAKEVDVRAEIQQQKIVPLRVQIGAFTYFGDLRVLEQYYQDLWRSYIFVTPEVFADANRCRAIVDGFCDQFHLEKTQAYQYVRTHDFTLDEGVTIRVLADTLSSFVEGLPFQDLPASVSMRLLAAASRDNTTMRYVGAGDHDRAKARLSNLLRILVLRPIIGEKPTLKGRPLVAARRYVAELEADKKAAPMAARGGPLLPTTFATYAEFSQAVIEEASDTRDSAR